jgi:hypothetical protein
MQLLVSISLVMAFKEDRCSCTWPIVHPKGFNSSTILELIPLCEVLGAHDDT